MPTFKYTAQPNKKFELLPDGDYLLEITAADQCLSQAPKYRGAEQFELAIKSVENGTEFTEWLTFHPDLAWKVDNFITCFGLAQEAGQEVELTTDNVVAARGWCAVGHYEKNGKKYNQIRVYYTDKEKYPRHGPQLAAVTAEPAPWEVQ